MSFDVERIRQSVRRVSKFLEKNSKRPSADAVHNLRTSTRSLETTFETLGLDKKGNAKRLLRHLGRVRKRAGKVRDMDVLVEAALTLKRNPDSEKACLVQLLEYLGAERNKYAKKLRREIEADRSQLRQDLKRNSKRLEDLLDQAKKNPGGSDAIPATAAKTIQLTADLKTPARLNRKNLHPYRLKVKQLRNVLQMSQQTSKSEFLEKIGEVKDAIGQWHDWEELIGIATQLLDHGPACKLVKRMKATSDSKYKDALSLTNRLRRNYLNGQEKDILPRTNGALVSEPVLEAAEAIAQD